MSFSYRLPSQNRWILPDSIRITEEYHYQADISHISDLKLSDGHPVPIGKFEFLISYDKWRTIGHKDKKLDDLFTISKYKRTDLDARLSSKGLKHDRFPLYTILQESLGMCPPQTRQMHDSGLITIQYQPQHLLKEPLLIEVKVYDQLEVIDTLSKLEERKRFFRRDRNETPYDLENEIAKQVINLVGFDNSLIFEFNLLFFIPIYVKLPEGESPHIQRIALKWPVPTSQRQIQLLCDNKPKTVTYDPKSGRLIFGNIATEPTNSLDNQLLSYYSPRLRFKINEPVELYHSGFDNAQVVIDGHLIVEIPALLSGMVFSENPATHRYNLTFPQIEMRSRIQINFRLFATQLFKRRYFSPFQHLQFPNIELNKMRLADIILLLKDLRFETSRHRIVLEDEEKPKLEGNPHHKQWLIIGERIEGARTLKLWIVVEGIPSGTQREKEIPGKEKYTTSLATGSMKLYIRGQIEEDMDRIIQVIKQIHEKLKERFQHVMVIE